jgi:hypothetical protein
MDWDIALLLVKQYGPLVLVVALLLWQGWMRECRLGGRINKLEDEQRKVLLPLVGKCTKVITRNTLIMRRLERALDERLGHPERPMDR